MKIDLTQDQISRLHELLEPLEDYGDITKILADIIDSRVYQVCLAFPDGYSEVVTEADERSCQETVKVMQRGQPEGHHQRYFYRVKE